MKLVTFLHESIEKIGAVVDDQIIDFSTSHLPKSMIEFIELGDDGINQANALIAKNDSKISINDVKLLAPIPRQNKILGVGLNYKAHKEEAAKAAADLLGKPQEKYPTIFNKQNSSVVGPYDDCLLYTSPSPRD